jgi:hypothetical protein
VNLIVVYLLPLMFAASIWGMPAFALERGASDASAGCAAGGDADRHMLLIAYTDDRMLLAAPGDSRTDRNHKDIAVKRDSTFGPAAGEEPAAGVTSRPGHSTGSLKVAARTVGDGQQEEWVRLADSPAPEPGIWAVLIAGFLGMCAVARPRIFSS